LKSALDLGLCAIIFPQVRQKREYRKTNKGNANNGKTHQGIGDFDYRKSE
jgi:hypothetical protein